MDLFFFLKKFITYFVTPPGLFVSILVLGLVFLRKRLVALLVVTVLLVYGLSIEPVKDLIVSPLEARYPVPSLARVKEAEVYVVLGHSMHAKAPDMYGEGVLEGDALHRVTTAYRLYLVAPKPIIVSGGTMKSAVSEAEVSRRYLLNLGVPSNMVIAEGKSRDTRENALFTHEICKAGRVNRIVLITSAVHMRRSVMLFAQHFDSVLPYPTAHKTSPTPYTFYALLPEAPHQDAISFAMKEYLGILFYTLVP